MTTRVPVQPHMLQWAFQRSGQDIEDVVNRFKKFPDWLEGETQPTLKQLETFAKAMYVPFGYLFLPEPPAENLPIPDFRTVNNQNVGRPSPNLLDTIYNCQERQSWYHEFAKVRRYDPVSFIGTATTNMEPKIVAQTIRDTMGFDINARQECRTFEDALRLFIRQAEEAGVLVMVSGIVQSNTRRTLNVKEFRGFALADDLAPLIFINGKDSKSAQMFTLAHELAHLWLGASGLSDTTAQPLTNATTEEVWCNQVAAELLVPLASLESALQADEPIAQAVKRLGRQFKVSGLVILRRLLDASWLTRPAFEAAWSAELARLHQLSQQSGSGGNFYNSTRSRLSSPFIQAIVGSTLEGQTLYRDAFRMLGVNNTATFKSIGESVGIPI